MSKKDGTISSTQSSSLEASCAALRLSPEAQGERGDSVETPVRELRVAVHKTSGNRYGSTKISNNASAVLGDVTHHNYFYGGKVPYLAGLQVYQDGDAVEPDTISDYEFNYARWLRSEQRLEHTCQWIFERPEYKKWLNSTGPPILIVSGTVGSGKSITASAVIDKLTLQQHNAQLVVSYFVDHSRDQPTSCIEILRALVKQILHFQRSLNEDISKGLQSSVKAVFSSTQARPSAKAITSLLSKCMLKIKSCVFVLDGIDALSEREIDEFLDFLHELFPLTKNQGSSRKLVVFCRRSLGRGVQLESIPSSVLCEVRLGDIQRDLFAFVEHEVDFRQRRRPITDDGQLITETKRVLKTHCGKMFLWIRLQILSLWDPGLINCDDDIRQQLSSLPAGLDEIYTRCLRRIEQTYSKNSREIAPKLFKWVACANEPLTQLQAREAVSTTPKNIPLRKSQILNTPAEDHCANLVTLDEISGRVVFPHPSVRDFLRDPLKMPSDLHHYLLSAETDELWCGEVCLAYANYLHNRKQIILYKTARVQKDIPTLFVKNVPGAWVSSLFRKPRPEQVFHMPLPMSTQATGDPQESCLHDYMRRNWLSHNRRIKPTAPNYATFATLCVGQDPQLHPWVTERITELEHFQRLFEFAIMTNHAPLLETVVNHFKDSTNDLVPQVLGTDCPGTDSSWLHVCAALGHKEVTQLVLRHCPKRTIAHGKSAAVLALEHKNFDLFGYLTPNPLPGPVWTLFSSGERKTYEENLLRACAVHGDGTVIDTMFDRLPQRPSPAYLSDALLHAWKYNSPEVSSKIVSAGANTHPFRLIEQDGEYYKSEFSSTSLESLSIVMAWYLGSLKPSKTQLINRILADQSWDHTHRRLQCLLRTTDGSETMDTPSVFRSLEILSQYLPAKRGSKWTEGVPTWFETIILYAGNTTSYNIHFWNRITRKLLTALDTSYMSRQVPAGEILRHGDDLHLRDDHLMFRWLDWIADDVLIHALKSDLIKEEYLLEPLLIERLARRETSRGLEAWLGSLRIEQTLCHRQSRDTSQRVCLSATLEILDLEISRKTYTLSGWHPTLNDYRELLSRLGYAAQRNGRVQVMDFLACYEFANNSGVTFGKGKHTLQDMLWVWDVSSLCGSESRSPCRNSETLLPATLTWLRLYSIHGDGANGSPKIQNDRPLRSMEGNVALNHPAGYVSTEGVPFGFHHLTATSDVTGQPVQRCIVEAVYHWNFRIRRKRRACFSEAEIWYMAYVLKWVGREYWREWLCR